jgi:hypothetical protein
MERTITPTTLEGIKRLAKEIKKSSALPHLVALDEAAKVARFRNFEHARQSLTSGHLLFITVYWTDDSDESRGRKTVALQIARPMLELCSKQEMKELPSLGAMRMVSENHLVLKYVTSSKMEALEAVIKAVSTCIFMQGTGLRPCPHIYANYPNNRLRTYPPNMDHPSTWRDVGSQQTILVYEPYGNPKVNSDVQKWADENNFHIRTSDWPGMYNPGFSHMFITTSAATDYDIDALMMKIDSLPTINSANVWNFALATDHSIFHSPIAHTANDKRKAIPHDLRRELMKLQ